MSDTRRINWRWPYRLTAGSWRQAQLLTVDIGLIIYASVFIALARGYDYGTGREMGVNGMRPSPALSLVERTAPLWLWSAAFLAGGFILLVGVATRTHLVVWLGHIWLFWAYAILMVGILVPTLTMPWFDGIRSATVLLLPALIHYVLSIRTGPKPVRHSDIRFTQRVGYVGDGK